MEVLIVALGNPGKKYENTKHNIGWIALDYFLRKNYPTFTWKEKFKGLYGAFARNDEKIHVVKPLTFMNLSGESVVACKQFFKLKTNQIFVLHDELDLNFGQAGVKLGGGLAGHNGLKSIAGLIGEQSFTRLRIGIGRPAFGSVSDWVLSEFTEDQKTDLKTYIEELSKVIHDCIEIGFDKSAKKYNKKKLI